MEKNTLGKTPSTDGIRDAVHVQIISARANIELRIGEVVRVFKKGGMWYASLASPCEDNPAFKACGIVDPFLTWPNQVVPSGSMVWICLYPDQITSLTHNWSHPLIPEGEGDTKDPRVLVNRNLEAAKSTLNILSDKLGFSPEEVLQEAKLPLEAYSGYYDVCFRGDLENRLDSKEQRDLILACSEILGIPVDMGLIEAGEFCVTCDC